MPWAVLSGTCRSESIDGGEEIFVTTFDSKQEPILRRKKDRIEIWS